MSAERQLSLALPRSVADAATPLILACMVNEWVYCPRLAIRHWFSLHVPPHPNPLPPGEREQLFPPPSEGEG